MLARMYEKQLKGYAALLERLHMVRGWNSSYLGLKQSPWTTPARCRGAARFPLDERPVDDQFGCHRSKLLPAPHLYLSAHRLETPVHPLHTDREAVWQSEALWNAWRVPA